MSEIPKQVLEEAGRVMYVCRLYDPDRHAGKSAVKCADCRRLVVVTVLVLNDRKRQAREAGRIVWVVCDECALRHAEVVGAAVVALPSAGEIAEANQ